jgi:hypothetical protein
VGLFIGAYRIVEQGWTIRDVNVELTRFHFNPYWTRIAEFLNRIDAESIRSQLTLPPPSTLPTSRKSAR